MGFFDNMFSGGPSDLNFDWDFSPENVQYNPSADYTQSIQNVAGMQGGFQQQQGMYNQYGKDFMSQSSELFDMGKDFLGPDSSYVTDAQNLFREDLMASKAETSRNIESQLAQQGVAGGIRSLISSQGGVGDDLRRSRIGFQQQSANIGTSVLGAGAQYGQVGSSLFGQANQAGGLALNAGTSAMGAYGNIDNNMLQTSLANAAATNAAGMQNQQGRWDTMSYNQNRQDSWDNQMGGLAMTALGVGLAPFTGGMSLGLAGMSNSGYMAPS